MKPRTQVEIKCATQAHADEIAATVNTLLGARDIFIQDVPAIAVQYPDQTYGVVCHIRFNSQADADQVRTALRTHWLTNPRILTGSRVHTHRCRHDEGIGDCSIDAEEVK